MSDESFGALLAGALARVGYSADDVAVRLGVASAVVESWLTGTAVPVKLEIIDALVEILQLNDTQKKALLTTLHSDMFIYIGTIYGSLNFGDGTQNVTTNYFFHLFAPGQVKRFFHTRFRFSEADPHMLTSPAGKAIWILSLFTTNTTPLFWLKFLSFISLWLFTAWMTSPFLLWPLPDTLDRLMAAARWGATAVVVPLIVALLTRADQEDRFLPANSSEKATLFFLKATGALVGFGVFAAITLFVAIVFNWASISLPPSVRWLLSSVPLLWSYVVAQRIPTDRYKMFGTPIQLHEADKLFFGVFLVIVPIIVLFIAYYHQFFAQPISLVAILAVGMAIAAWEQRKHHPEWMPEPLFVMFFVVVFPIALLGVVAYASLGGFGISSADDLWLTLLAFGYVLGPLIIFLTLLVRNPPTITLRGALGLLVASILLSAVTLLNRTGALWLMIGLAIVWLGWGRRRWRNELWVHSSVAVGIGLAICSFGIVFQNNVPHWLNAALFFLASSLSVLWAYKSKNLAQTVQYLNRKQKR